MDWWMAYRIKQEQFQAEADRQRLLAAAQNKPVGPSAFDRVLAALGRRLSSWGEQLQAHALQHAPRREALA